MTTPDPDRAGLTDLPVDLANALVREFAELEEDSPLWCPGEWAAERAILNRIFRLGQEQERKRHAAPR